MQAGCLRRLERLTSVATAARASVLGAFTAGKGHSADADYSPRAWLIHKTGITRGTAVSYTAWAKRAAAHSRVFEVLAGDGDVSESFARTICLWTDKLPAAWRDAADGILMGAAVSGLALEDLAVLASEMLARSWQPDRQDPTGGPEDRGGQAQGHPDGEPGGDEPGADHGDGGGGDPDGQSVDGGNGMPGGDPDGDGEGGQPGEGLDPEGSPDGVFEDRALKLLTGDVDPGAFDDLVRLCVALDKLRHGPDRTARSREALEQAIVGKAAALLSGPGGLASFLRRRLLGARLGGPSLPLDIGYSDTVPASIRNAVRLRDLHCQWAGRCDQPASACEVHHTRHKANGGKTSLKDCVLLCRFHHQIAIHRWGWTLLVNPDGTTSAWNKNKTKVLHSHSPPARAG